MKPSDRCLRCKSSRNAVAMGENQSLCRDCATKVRREKREAAKLKQKQNLPKKCCRCGSTIGVKFMISKPLSEYSITQLKKVMLLCLNCLDNFQTR